MTKEKYEKRDLHMAKNAYAKGDLEMSKAVHSKLVGSAEAHLAGGDKIKSVVFGGMDGIITTFAVVAGAVGGGLGTKAILTLGFSSILADAVSMGLGDALSSKAEIEYILAERKREEWEYENNKEGEVEEMVDLYVERGLPEEDARKVMDIMSQHGKFFVDLMMVEELGLMMPQSGDGPWKDGFYTFCSFAFFGTWPLLGYVFFAKLELGTDTLFAVACAVTAVVLFLLGSVKSKFSTNTWYWSGLETLTMGSIAAAIAYLTGFLVGHAVG